MSNQNHNTAAKRFDEIYENVEDEMPRWKVRAFVVSVTHNIDEAYTITYE